MHVTAKADYAIRAVVELAYSGQESPRKVDEVARAQGIPVSFLENILTQLRSSGIVRSQRGPEGGYWLAQPSDQINLARVIRAVEGRWLASGASAPRRSNTSAWRNHFSRYGSRCEPIFERCLST